MSALVLLDLREHPLFIEGTMLNRAALILRAKKPFIDWVRSTDDDPAVPDPDGEQTVYLFVYSRHPGDAEAYLRSCGSP